MECAIFFIYTKALLDVKGRGFCDRDDPVLEIPSSELDRPVISFDIMELFQVADFLGIEELMSLMHQAFFSKESLFSQMPVPCSKQPRQASSSSSSSSSPSPSPSVQPPVQQLSSSMEEKELVVARMMMRCARLQTSALLDSLAVSYAQGTGGLRCLCMWPTRYNRYIFHPFLCSSFFSGRSNETECF